ncbi:hypothetical protein QR680_002656 [Steinernema hermaphroditum]|uniref:Uncharacterized protein n=1 Tax=Steinernema hermaphroditum TaxID=289476 RepID=A0AA39LIL1_9BILA|nr:hypothetical protein QR680_002656 [Steinernema hermaphroditum]
MWIWCFRIQLFLGCLGFVNAFKDSSLLPDLIESSGKKCWGYEKGCSFENSYSKDRLRCHKPSRWPSARTKEDQMNAFFDQADFGYVRQRMESMQPICSSNRESGAFLECTDHLRFCRGRNILFDFKSLNAKRSKRYRDDVIHEGEVGGDCDSFDKELLRKRSDEKSYLQSWGHELTNFESSSEYAVTDKNCDIIYERPTILFKLDASVNMYHHFCDFINLFASQFINGTFNDDVDIVWWETHSTGYQDRYFGATWKAFSKHAPHELISLDQKRVCFRNVMFPLLARQRFGLYYNMPLIDGCEEARFIDGSTMSMRYVYF